MSHLLNPFRFGGGSPTPGLIDSCVPANLTSYYSLFAGTAGAIRHGQCIALSAEKTLTSVKFPLARTGTPTGNLKAVIFAVTGTPGTDAEGTGSVLATSSAVNANVLGTTGAWVEFTFSPGYVKNGNVFVGVDITDATTDTSNTVEIFFAAAGSHPGNTAYYYYTGSQYSWTNETNDTGFYLYGY